MYKGKEAGEQFSERALCSWVVKEELSEQSKKEQQVQRPMMQRQGVQVTDSARTGERNGKGVRSEAIEVEGKIV